MDESKSDWDDLRLFLAVARSGGLTAAVELTGKSAPTLGRRMQQLEKRLGEELFQRQTNGYVLTEQGQLLLTQLGPVEEAIVPLASGGHRPAMVVKISAGSWMTRLLCQHARSLIDNRPELRLRFIAAEHTLSIAHRETVIGIRNQRPAHQALVCRRLGKVRFAGYALGKKLQPWIRVSGQTPTALWLADQTRSSGTTLGIELTAPRNALDLALSGAGTALLPTFVGDAEKRLTPVTPEIIELAHEQWLVVHQAERRRPEVRATIDWIVALAGRSHERSAAPSSVAPSLAKTKA